jgi:hypothetical protein
MRASKPKPVLPEEAAIRHGSVLREESPPPPAQPCGTAPVATAPDPILSFQDMRTTLQSNVTTRALTAANEPGISAEAAIDAGAYEFATDLLQTLARKLKAGDAGALHPLARAATEAWRLQRESAGLPREKPPAPPPPKDSVTFMRLLGPNGEVLEVREVKTSLADDYRAGRDQADAGPEPVGEAARESATGPSM